VSVPGTWEAHHADAPTNFEFPAAMAEAHDWLRHHGLVSPYPGDETGRGYVTRRGVAFLEHEDPIAVLQAEERIGVELHPSIASEARRQFLGQR
jgi:hypothetical protein